MRARLHDDVCECPGEEQKRELREALGRGGYDAVLLGLFTTVSSYRIGSGTLQGEQIGFIRELMGIAPDMIVLLFGSPYVLRELDALRNGLCMYGGTNEAIDSSLRAVFGQYSPTGKLPVDVSETYRYGHGLRI
ncbi:MAG: beta-N-acetylhexosaminidase [Paenibacillus sp.]|nr:beta-N-acetylhexosaminidase [Paenibacillus sp.]